MPDIFAFFEFLDPDLDLKIRVLNTIIKMQEEERESMQMELERVKLEAVDKETALATMDDTIRFTMPSPFSFDSNFSSKHLSSSSLKKLDLYQCKLICLL